MSRHRQLSLGVLGLGAAWEAAYRPALDRLGPRVRLTAVHGSCWRSAAELAQHLGAIHAGSVRQFVRHDADGILLIGPGWQQWFPLRAAIEAGRSVYVCLPPGDDVAPLAPLQAAAQAAGVLVVPELRLRYTPATLRLRELLATELGPLETIEIRALAHGLAARVRVERELIDWSRVVLGTLPRAVACRDDAASSGGLLRTLRLGFDRPGGKSERVWVSIVLPAATPGSGEEARPADTWPLEFAVRGKYGEARLEDAAQVRWREGGREQVESLSADRTAVSVAVDHFARRLAGGLIPVPDLGDVLQADRIAALAARSRAEGGAELPCRTI